MPGSSSELREVRFRIGYQCLVYRCIRLIPVLAGCQEVVILISKALRNEAREHSAATLLEESRNFFSTIVRFLVQSNELMEFAQRDKDRLLAFAGHLLNHNKKGWIRGRDLPGSACPLYGRRKTNGWCMS